MRSDLRFISDVEYVCSCCGVRQAIRGDYCLTCEDAVRNELMAELCDVDTALTGDDVDTFAAEQSIVPLWIGPCACCGLTGTSCVTRSCPRCGERAVA